MASAVSSPVATLFARPRSSVDAMLSCYKCVLYDLSSPVRKSFALFYSRSAHSTTCLPPTPPPTEQDVPDAGRLPQRWMVPVSEFTWSTIRTNWSTPGINWRMRACEESLRAAWAHGSRPFRVWMSVGEHDLHARPAITLLVRRHWGYGHALVESARR
jgi:hypothetical protein